MPICKKCNERFPKKIVLNGKEKRLSNRKYCLNCSPWMKHNTKQLDKQNLPNHKCSICNREYQYNRHTGHTLTKCNSCMANSRRNKTKLKCVEYKGNKCQVCGYDKCIQNLCFHHLFDKKFDISGNHCRKWEAIQPELDKCILLCANCHGELHAGLIQLNSPSGS